MILESGPIDTLLTSIFQQSLIDALLVSISQQITWGKLLSVTWGKKNKTGGHGYKGIYFSL